MNLIDDLPDGPMKQALQEQASEMAQSFLKDYLAFDELTQADIRAFFESQGPKRVHEKLLKNSEGTPTSSDLKSWYQL